MRLAVGGLLGGIGLLSGNPMMAMGGLQSAVGQRLSLDPRMYGGVTAATGTRRQIAPDLLRHMALRSSGSTASGAERLDRNIQMKETSDGIL